MSNELYFETGGGDNARSDKKIKSACSRILGIEVSITRDVISPGAHMPDSYHNRFFLNFLMSNWACFEICPAVYTSSKIVGFQ